MGEFEVGKHMLVPKHSKISEKEKKELMEKYSASLKDFPKILVTDPSLQGLDVKEGDIFKIERKSKTAGTSMFYRRVVNA